MERHPYQLVGVNSVKALQGDCSGTTFRIYEAAGFPYSYTVAASFPTYAASSKLFRKLSKTEKLQDGDILSWSSHVAIYCSFATDTANATTPRVNDQGARWTQKNDMWTATRPGGKAYGPGASIYFRPDKPSAYRYQK